MQGTLDSNLQYMRLNVNATDFGADCIMRRDGGMPPVRTFASGLL